MPYLLAMAIGFVAGSRTMMAPAAVSLAARAGVLPLGGTPLAFLGYTWTPWIMVLLAAVELVVDQLPSTPSRRVPVQFGARLVTGTLSGAAIGIAAGSLPLGAVAGCVGAVIGTLACSEARTRMAARFGSDRPAAIIEDVFAIGAAAGIVALVG